jgi:hypothetical protein
MPYSVLVGDKVHDIQYEKYGEFGWTVKLNDKSLGVIFNCGRRLGWDVVIYKQAGSTQAVKGFVNKDKAVTYILEVLGYHHRADDYLLEYMMFQYRFNRGVN